MNKIEYPDYEVLIRCNTYNQKSFILEALNGFTAQITDFPYMCLIVDDNSTDGEQELLHSYIRKECNILGQDVIEEVANLAIVQSRYNSNCYYVFFFLKENLFKQREKKNALVKPWIDRSKFVAFCEGDDYWIDPQKLQKQVDFLNNHKDYTLIGSNGLVLYTDIFQGINYFNNCHDTREVTYSELVDQWFFPTASLLFRTSIYDVYPLWAKEIHFGDDVIVMTCANHGKVACLGDLTCVYRKGTGISTELDKQYIYMCQQHKLFYQYLLNDSDEQYKDCIRNKISIYDKELKYYKLKERIPVLICLFYPHKYFKMVLIKVFKYLYKTAKRFV